MTVPSLSTCSLASDARTGAHGRRDRCRPEVSPRSSGSRCRIWLTAILLVAIPAVLARLLTPEDLGLLEIALAFFGAGDAVHGAGHRPRHYPAAGDRRDVSLDGLLRQRGDRRCFRDRPDRSAQTASPAGCAWILHLVGILRWLGLTLIPLSTAIVPRNLLARRLPYRRMTMADALAGAAATLAAFAVLSRGLDVALTLGFVTYGTRRHHRPVDRRPLVAVGARRIRERSWPLLRFSLSVSGSRMLENLSLQSDRFLIGRYLGAASLGLFGLARTLVRVPLRYLLNVSDEVLLSGLALLQTDRATRARVLPATLRIELAILGPAVVFAAVFAVEFSRLLFGPSWDRAGGDRPAAGVFGVAQHHRAHDRGRAPLAWASRSAASLDDLCVAALADAISSSAGRGARRRRPATRDARHDRVDHSAHDGQPASGSHVADSSRGRSRPLWIAHATFWSC